MKMLMKVVALTAIAGVLHTMGNALPSACANVSPQSSVMQKSIDSSIASESKQMDSLSATFLAKQPGKIPIRPADYSDDPTIPGSGTPQRSQGTTSR